MQKQVSSALLLIVALLFSAWSNVIGATFCPRYMTNRELFEHKLGQRKQVRHQPSCHQEMTGMEQMPMDNLQVKAEAQVESRFTATQRRSHVEVASESSADQVALDIPIEACNHCWTHSQPTSGAVTPVAVDPLKRLAETDSAPPSFTVALPSGFSVPITPLEHGPPGNSFPRYVLINVFRI